MKKKSINIVAGVMRVRISVPPVLVVTAGQVKSLAGICHHGRILMPFKSSLS